MENYATKLAMISENPKFKRWLPYLLAILLIAPSLIWVSLDRHVWGVDQAWYGEVSIDLFYTLTHQPANWLAEMMAAFGTKTPAIAWFGQFFVPVGFLLGSTDAGLLVSVLVVQAVSLVLMFRTVQHLWPGRTLIAMAAAVSMASAPLFVGMSHQYFVEPLQLLAVVWFILIMSFAPTWNRAFVLAQLLAAASFAMLAKLSSPVFCIGPGLVALTTIFWSNSDQAPFNWKQKRTVITAISALLLSIAAIYWYARNLETALQHAARSSSGRVAELFGKSDTFLNTLYYWLGATQRSFYLPVVLVIVSLAVGGGIIIYVAKHSPRMKHTTLYAATALLQIILVLATFSLSANRENRYLLPLLPYFSLLIGWALLQINKRLVTGVVVMAFSLQLLVSFGQALGIVSPNPQISYWLQPIQPNSHDATVLRAIVSRTCTETGRERYSVVAVNLSWLNDHAASYYASKQRLQNGVKCYYSSIGFAQTDLKEAEKFVKAVNPLYIVTVDPKLHNIPSGPFNRVSEDVLKRVLASDEVYLGPSLAADPGVLIFYRTHDNPPHQ